MSASISCCVLLEIHLLISISLLSAGQSGLLLWCACKNGYKKKMRSAQALSVTSTKEAVVSSCPVTKRSLEFEAIFLCVVLLFLISSSFSILLYPLFLCSPLLFLSSLPQKGSDTHKKVWELTNSLNKDYCSDFYSLDHLCLDGL